MSVLVTGAGGAIGGAIVRQLLDRGETVIAQDLNAAALESLAGDVVPVPGDLLEPETSERLIDLANHSGMRSVIAAHGVDGSRPLAKLDSAFYRRIMAVNASSVIALYEALAPTLASEAVRGGAKSTFVVVSSQAGISAEADNVAYSASKFALIGWAKGIRAAASADGIHVRVAAPGCTETPLFLSAQAEFAETNGVSPAAFLQRRLDRIPTGAFASTEQTAATIVYLSDGSAHRPFLLAGTGGETRH